MRVLGIYSDFDKDNRPKGCGFYRIVQPMSALREQNSFKVDVAGQIAKKKLTLKGLAPESKEELWTRVFQEYDLLYCQHPDGIDALSQMYGARDYFKKRVIIDLDDDIYHINPKSPQYFSFHKNPNKLKFVEMGIRFADALIVSTPELKKLYSPLNKNIFVVENSFDPQYWYYDRSEKDDGYVRVGFAGSNSHVPDIEFMMQTIEQTLKNHVNVKFVILGFWHSMLNSIPKDQIEYISGTKTYNFYDWPKLLAKSGIDIGICPLATNQFNRGKSPIKFFEYSAYKIPTVASGDSSLPFSKVIEHGKTGFLAQYHKDWMKYLDLLITHPEKRAEIGQAAHDYVLENHHVEDKLDLYKEIFQKVSGEIYDPAGSGISRS